jgi:hypothetical protein
MVCKQLISRPLRPLSRTGNSKKKKKIKKAELMRCRFLFFLLLKASTIIIIRARSTALTLFFILFSCLSLEILSMVQYRERETGSIFKQQSLFCAAWLFYYISGVCENGETKKKNIGRPSRKKKESKGLTMWALPAGQCLYGNYIYTWILFII